MYYLPKKANLITSSNAESGKLDESCKSSNASSSDRYRYEHKYELSDFEIYEIFHKRIYLDVIESKAFQRLKDIMFLGSIDYVLDIKNNKSIKRHNRFQHSLGVARLALQFSEEKKLSERQENICVVAALLHDIGHAPLSHSLESVFKEHFGISHHDAGEQIIKGDVKIGKGLHKILVKWDINPFEILSIIDGKGGRPYNDVFSHSINIDTIEGISRSYKYIKPDNDITYPVSVVLDALINLTVDSKDVLDKFWDLKHEVYSRLINSRLGVLADFICQDYMRTHSSKFKKEYYFGDEDELIINHAALFDRLICLGRGSKKLFSANLRISCFKRSFFIDENVGLDSLYSIDARYKQKKEPYDYKIRI